MRLLVVSDTHRVTGALMNIIRQNSSLVQGIIHLGDHDFDLFICEGLSQAEYYTVAGNCDNESLSKRERVLELNGFRIFMTHGNTYHVGIGTERLAARAAEVNAQVCLYGHTHISTLFTENGILFMNPGSLLDPRDDKPPSYAFLDLDETTGTAAGSILFI